MEPIEGNYRIVKLTEEEASMEITIERIIDYHYTVGEDFLDREGYYVFQDEQSLYEYLISVTPEHTGELVTHANGDYCLVQLNEIYDYDDILDCEEHYKFICNYANLHPEVKKRFNEVLIAADRYYNQ